MPNKMIRDKHKLNASTSDTWQPKKLFFYFVGQIYGNKNHITKYEVQKNEKKSQKINHEYIIVLFKINMVYNQPTSTQKDKINYKS